MILEDSLSYNKPYACRMLVGEYLKTYLKVDILYLKNNI